MRRLSESSVRGWRTAKKKGAIKERKIAYSDIPPLSDKQLASMRRVGRPPLGERPRRLIAIRLDTYRQVISKWRKRFYEEGMAGLEERPRRGRPGFSPRRSDRD